MILVRYIKLIVVFMIVSWSGIAIGQTTDNDQSEQPIGHIEISDPAKLTADEANAVYRDTGAELARRYAQSKDPAAMNFRSWSQHAKSPYLSATHGARFVNNYANAVAKDYGKLKKRERHPVGSVLAKDSFTVTKDGNIYPGALFIMEKKPAGFNKSSADWQYRMILPDGSLFGSTKGENAENVKFCIACHAQKSDWDHIFHVPEKYRK